MSPVEKLEDGSGGGPEAAPGSEEDQDFTADFPPAARLVSQHANYAVVAFDLDSTGRRLLDEICQIGGFTGPDNTFSQYVMPYKNPNPGARRSFGIRVVNIGRYRMLKDMDTGKILKTKSEVSALQDFISWLQRIKNATDGADGVILTCHESSRKVLIPLLLEALYKYNLMDSFKGVVRGFANSILVVKKYGDEKKITSHSLRSLCKTVLNDTNPNTASASSRCRLLVDIISRVTSTPEQSRSKESLAVDVAKVASVAVTVDSEEDDLRHLKDILGTEGTLRPIFESMLKQRRGVRVRAMKLRKHVAEVGLDYAALQAMCTSAEDPKEALTGKIPTLGEEDVNELVELLKTHFQPKSSTTAEGNNGTDAGEENADNEAKL